MILKTPRSHTHHWWILIYNRAIRAFHSRAFHSAGHRFETSVPDFNQICSLIRFNIIYTRFMVIEFWIDAFHFTSYNHDNELISIKSSIQVGIILQYSRVPKKEKKRKEKAIKSQNPWIYIPTGHYRPGFEKHGNREDINLLDKIYIEVIRSQVWRKLFKKESGLGKII